MVAFSNRRGGVFEWGVTGVFGLVLTLMAAPRLIAEYYHQGAAPVVRAITESGGAMAGGMRTTALEKLSDALFYASRNRTLYNSRATVELSLYERSKSKRESDEAFEALSRAHVDFQKALKSAPGDANIWYLLAETRARLSGVDARVLEALRLSYLTGPREGWIVRRRLGLSLRLWPLLRPDTQRMVRRDIRTLWSGGQYHLDLVRHYMGAAEAGREAVIAEISKNGKNQQARFLKLAAGLAKRR